MAGKSEKVVAGFEILSSTTVEEAPKWVRTVGPNREKSGDRAAYAAQSTLTGANPFGTLKGGDKK